MTLEVERHGTHPLHAALPSTKPSQQTTGSTNLMLDSSMGSVPGGTLYPDASQPEASAVIDDDENENRSGRHKSTNTAIDFVPGTLAKVVPHDSHSSSPPTIGSSGRKSTRSSSGYTSNDVSIAPCECYST